MKTCRRSESTAPLVSPTSRRELLQLAAATACWPLLATAQERSPKLLPLRTTGLQHFGMQVADVEVAGQFYGPLFSPTLTKEPNRRCATTSRSAVTASRSAAQTDARRGSTTIAH